MANTVCHIELSTDNTANATKFYKKLFAWKTSEMPMGPGMTYTLVDLGSKDCGGGITAKQMPGQPTAWLPYILVDSVKKSVAKAEKLGATIMLPFMPIPGQGAIGIFADPTGGVIGVYEAGKKPVAKPVAKKAAKKVAVAPKPAAKKAAKKVAAAPKPTTVKAAKKPTTKSAKK